MSLIRRNGSQLSPAGLLGTCICWEKHGKMLTKAPISRQLDSRPLAHCATLVVLGDGSLLAAWFAGSYETAPDVAILAAGRAAHEESWSQPQVIAGMAGHSLGQPVFLTRPDGELWLFFVVIMGRDWTSAQPYWQRSRDNGQSWEPPMPLLDYPGLMFRSRPVSLPGRYILPVYDENTWQSRMLISDDDGQSWRLTQPISTPDGNIHPCVVQVSGGRLLAYLRTRGGRIWRTESLDGGECWSSPTPTPIPNPNSGIDLLRLRSGALVLAFNNSDRLRTPLCVALAEEGERWRWRQILEDGYAEYSYPTLAQTSDGQIHMVYTYRREHIECASFSEDWLRENEIHE
jgi:predicted neuraminidase